MSGVGKGIATASIGKILQAEGFRVNPIKVDPYLNVDAGTMNPTEHGEVFVLDSGLECDQDMGNYERFMDLDLSNTDYITSGMVYQTVIDKERNLGYKGKCVEAVPHITGEITRRIELAAKESRSEISIIEIGGTVGDYQSVLFIEAARVLRLKHPADVIFIMVSYLPIPGTLGEMKTRPTQHAVRALNSYGVQPDMIIARSKVPLDHKRKEKIALSCAVLPDHVISAPDIESIYDAPLNFEHDSIGEILLKTLNLKRKNRKNGMVNWRGFVNKIRSAKKYVDIGIIGKYFDTGDFILSDTYISVIEAVRHAAYTLGFKPRLTWLNAKDFEAGKRAVSELSKYHGIIVPGGFGESGIEGKLKAIEFARTKKIPYLGLCYGMQLLVIEYARNVLGLRSANTTEIDLATADPVIDIMPDQKEKLARADYGGSMRLGAYPAYLAPGTIAFSAYADSKSYKLKANGYKLISERHRHRYEVNPAYIAKLEAGGMVFSGQSLDGTLMEIAELPKKVHPFFLGSQFHPEFKSRPLRPHPLFTSFIRAAIEFKKK